MAGPSPSRQMGTRVMPGSAWMASYMYLDSVSGSQTTWVTPHFFSSLTTPSARSEEATSAMASPLWQRSCASWYPEAGMWSKAPFGGMYLILVPTEAGEGLRLGWWERCPPILRSPQGHLAVGNMSQNTAAENSMVILNTAIGSIWCRSVGSCRSSCMGLSLRPRASKCALTLSP